MQRIIAVAGMLLLSGTVFAATEPQGIAMGGGSLVPTLQIGHSYNDNLFSSEVFEDSSQITNLKPRIEWYAERDEDTYFSIAYDGDFAKYWDSRDDDYDDHTLSLIGSFRSTDMVKAVFDASAAKMHDNRGEGASEGLGAVTRGAPDEYDQSNAGIRFDFGREDATFGAMVEARILDVEYTNNRAVTRFRDRDDAMFHGRLFARIAPKTRGFVGYRVTDIEYDEPTATGAFLDSDEMTITAGLEWEATAKTTGSIEIGRLEKEFDGITVDGDDSDEITVWNVQVSWQPRTYSTFTLTTSKDAGETNGTGAYMEAQNTNISWTHDWSERLHSVVSAGVGEDEYPGSNREDDRVNYSVGVNYDWQRWMNIGLTYTYDDRDSNFILLDYERNVFALTIDLSL